MELKKLVLKIIYLEKKWNLSFYDIFKNVYLFIFFKMMKGFMKYRKINHYFNEVMYTRYPFLISYFVYFIILIFLNYLFIKNIEYFVISMLFVLVLLLETVQGWSREMIIESFFMGKYNKKVQRCIHTGVLLFIISEIMVFVGFFWVYLDRCFHLPSVLGSVPAQGIEHIYFYKRPIIATAVLLISTQFMNTGYGYYLCGCYILSTQWHQCCTLFGIVFLLIQIFEYMHLLICFNDSVYGSSFYVLTGFHCFHVFIGITLLMLQNERIFELQINPKQNTGHNMSMLYWHFVDYVWCVLFVLVYMY